MLPHLRLPPDSGQAPTDVPPPLRPRWMPSAPLQSQSPCWTASIVVLIPVMAGQAKVTKQGTTGGCRTSRQCSLVVAGTKMPLALSILCGDGDVQLAHLLQTYDQCCRFRLQFPEGVDELLCTFLLLNLDIFQGSDGSYRLHSASRRSAGEQSHVRRLSMSSMSHTIQVKDDVMKKNYTSTS